MAGVEDHDARTDLREVVLDPVVFYGLRFGQDLIEQTPQLRNVPLAVAEVVKTTPDRLLGCDLETAIEGGIGPLDDQLAGQHQERVVDGADDRLCKRLWSVRHLRMI